MSTAPSETPEYEFDAPKSEVIRQLARRMGGVAFLIVVLGSIQIAHGIFAAYLGYRDPAKLTEVAKKQLPADQMEKFEKMVGMGGWTPFVLTGAAVAAMGLIHFLFGLWTQSAAGSLSAVAETRGKDITRLMDALGSLNKAYGLIYNLILIAAVVFLVSLLCSFFGQRAA